LTLAERVLNYFCLRSASFVCPRFVHEATLRLQSIPAAQAGTWSEHPSVGTGAAGAGKVLTGKPGETETLL